ncbi:MAG: hypothetical protein ABJC55_08370, partial [Algoriphagus sp.]
KWAGQLIVLSYSLLPLPTTPLFLGAGISKLNPIYIIPAFLVGKFTSDTLAIFAGAYAVTNAQSILENALSWQSILSLLLGLFLLFCLFFVDWRTLILHRKLIINYRILK